MQTHADLLHARTAQRRKAKFENMHARTRQGRKARLERNTPHGADTLLVKIETDRRKQKTLNEPTQTAHTFKKFETKHEYPTHLYTAISQNNTRAM